MSHHRWFKFWAAEYLTDAKVDALDPNAQALLIRMWCVISMEDSISCDPQEIARKTMSRAAWVSEWIDLLGDLLQKRGDRFYSLRMEAERKKSDAGRFHVAKRYKEKEESKHLLGNLVGLPSRLPSTKKKEERVNVGKLFDYYCLRVKRNRTQYTLTEKRIAKGLSRWEECLLGRTEDEATERFKKAIDNLSSTEYNMENGYYDWIDHLCKSTEEFEKRLNWIKPNGGSNGHYQGNQPKTGGNLNALNEVIERNRNRGIADGTELRENGDHRREHLGLPEPAVSGVLPGRRTESSQTSLPYQATPRRNGVS